MYKMGYEAYGEINNKFVYEKFENAKIGFSVFVYPYLACENNSLITF